MTNLTKVWKLELTSAELAILKIALARFVHKYDGDAFTKEEIQGAVHEVNTYNYINPFKKTI